MTSLNDENISYMSTDNNYRLSLSSQKHRDIIFRIKPLGVVFFVNQYSVTSVWRDRFSDDAIIYHLQNLLFYLGSPFFRQSSHFIFTDPIVNRLDDMDTFAEYSGRLVINGKNIFVILK